MYRIFIHSQRDVIVPDDAADCLNGDLACGPRDDKPKPDRVLVA